jgi:uncharacterized protein YjbI with pentapeptide repeats
VNLRGADLCGAFMCESDMRHVNVCRAKLFGADMDGVRLRAGDLFGSDIEAVVRLPRGVILRKDAAHKIDLGGVISLRGYKL